MKEYFKVVPQFEWFMIQPNHDFSKQDYFKLKYMKVKEDTLIYLILKNGGLVTNSMGNKHVFRTKAKAIKAIEKIVNYKIPLEEEFFHAVYQDGYKRIQLMYFSNNFYQHTFTISIQLLKELFPFIPVKEFEKLFKSSLHNRFLMCSTKVQANKLMTILDSWQIMKKLVDVSRETNI